MDHTPADALPPSANAAPDIPDFELVREIGRGGFGRVWMARNRATGQLRAVKVIPRFRTGTADPAGREIVSITRLELNLRRQHPNLLGIHHVGQTPDHLFYVMDLADDAGGREGGQTPGYQPATLQHRLAGRPLAAGECLVCARQLLSGLASLHEAGMVHRDVKPANCLFVDGTLRLADFGLLTEASPQVSRLGTEKYMPPDGRMDARADVYAAGLVVYEMVTGFPIERFPHLGQRADAIAADPRLSALLRLALDACQPAPGERFRDAGEMLAALEKQLCEGSPVFRLRRRAVVGLAGMAIVAAAAAIGYWWMVPPRVHVNFVTYPFDATILLDGRALSGPGGTPLKTPCTVEDLPAWTHHVTFRHPAWPDLDAGPVDFARTRQVVASWEYPPAEPDEEQPLPAPVP